jgi:hypothetical protein
MNYQKIYNNLIDRANTRITEGYVEKHHIVPRCLGGTDDPSNLASLTPEEHFLAHQLLVKLHPTNVHLANAAMIMTIHNTEARMNNKLFGWLRKRASQTAKGRPKSEETKAKMRKPKSVEHRANISKAQKANGGNGPANHKEESKNKTRVTMKLRPRANKVCPHCNKEGGFLSMSRWHFDNCKEKNVISAI